MLFLNNPCFKTEMAFDKAHFWLCAAYQVLGEVVDKLSVM